MKSAPARIDRPQPTGALRRSTIIALGAIALAACTETEPSIEPRADSGRGRSDTGAGFDASSSSDSGVEIDVVIASDARTSRGEVCGNGLDDNFDGRSDEGCVCTTGMTQQCFSGDPARAGVGMCSLGTQMCVGDGEFGHWAACEGSVDDPSCGPGSRDAGAPADTGVGDSGVDCPCVAGTARYCDTPVGCLWGIQLCRSNGTWGVCNETRMVPAECREEPFGDLFGHTYDTECCVRSGGCCQNYPADNTVGRCPGILSCQ